MQAPVIELSRAQKRLIARGEASTGWSAATQAAQVHTVLVSDEGGAAGVGTGGAGKPGSTAGGCANTGAKAGTGKAGAAAQAPNVVRIASGGLVYSGLLNQADFTGGFRADTAEGTIRANAGTAYSAAGCNGECDGWRVGCAFAYGAFRARGRDRECRYSAAGIPRDGRAAGVHGRRPGLSADWNQGCSAQGGGCEGHDDSCGIAHPQYLRRRC